MNSERYCVKHWKPQIAKQFSIACSVQRFIDEHAQNARIWCSTYGMFHSRRRKEKKKNYIEKKQKKKISKTMTTNVSFLFHFRRFINFMCIDFRIAIIFTEIENEIEIFLLPLVVMIRLAFLKESLFCITFYDQRNNYKRKYFRSSQEQRLSHTILSKKKKKTDKKQLPFERWRKKKTL